MESEVAAHLDYIVEKGFSVLLADTVDEALVKLQGVEAVHIKRCK